MIRGFCGMIYRRIIVIFMADSNAKIKPHDQDPFKREQPGDFRGNVVGNEEWVKKQEELVGSKLQGMIRKSIAVAMAREDKTPIDALEKVKGEYFEADESDPDVQTINKIIGRIHSLAPIPAVTEIEKEESKAEVFRNKLKRSLGKSVFEATKKRKFNISEKTRKAASEIDDIFKQVKDGHEVGLILDAEELQAEVDDLVRKFGFDKEIFSGAVIKYDSLLELPEELVGKS